MSVDCTKAGHITNITLLGLLRMMVTTFVKMFKILYLYMQGVSKKVYSWKIFLKLTSAQNSPEISVSLGSLALSVHLALNLFKNLSFLEREMCC